MFRRNQMFYFEGRWRQLHFSPKLLYVSARNLSLQQVQLCAVHTLLTAYTKLTLVLSDLCKNSRLVLLYVGNNFVGFHVIFIKY